MTSTSFPVIDALFATMSITSARLYDGPGVRLLYEQGAVTIRAPKKTSLSKRDIECLIVALEKARRLVGRTDIKERDLRTPVRVPAKLGADLDRQGRRR